ncbi:RNA-directed DNA polymerase, eukaryota [Tanacetum coccineum]
MERVCNQPNFNTRADGAAEDDNDNGWQTVEKRRNKAQKLNRTTTYLFTDIPPGWNDNALWKLFSKYRRISDVYIAKKKTAKGKDFGFARFLNVSNLTSKNNLVAGKVCIRTKHMEFIQTNMPVLVDGVHVCLRIREIQGECDEIYTSKKTANSSYPVKEDEASINRVEQKEDSDTDDFDDDASDEELFMDKCEKEYLNEGDWIRSNSQEVQGKRQT